MWRCEHQALRKALASRLGGAGRWVGPMSTPRGEAHAQAGLPHGSSRAVNHTAIYCLVLSEQRVAHVTHMTGVAAVQAARAVRLAAAASCIYPTSLLLFELSGAILGSRFEGSSKQCATTYVAPRGGWLCPNHRARRGVRVTRACVVGVPARRKAGRPECRGCSATTAEQACLWPCSRGGYWLSCRQRSIAVNH